MTVSERIERAVTCPICQSNVDRLSLARVGLSIEELTDLEEYVKTGKIKDLLNIAEIAMRWLGDPEKTKVQLQIKSLEQCIHQIFTQISEKMMKWGSEISERGDKGTGNVVRDLTTMKNDLLREFHDATRTISQDRIDMMRELNDVKQGITAISTKIVGTGIGKVSEKALITDLKSAVSNTGDSFSDEHASKQGTDIVCTVRDKGRDCGKISISVKDTKQWESNFIVQLNKNMRDDGTRLGILATRILPADSLHQQIYVPPDCEVGKSIIFVKLEYVALAYFALRQVAIHLFETQQTLDMKDAETDEAMKAFKLLMMYINGPNFQQTISHIDKTIKDAQDTRSCLTQIRTYVNTNIDKSIKFQNSIEENLNHAKALIWKLRELLNGDSHQ
jgi:hypothetical protein